VKSLSALMISPDMAAAACSEVVFFDCSVPGGDEIVDNQVS
jgi:hypothetical protein